MKNLVVLLFLIVVVNPYEDLKNVDPNEIIVIDLDYKRDGEIKVYGPEEDRDPPPKHTRFYCDFCAPPQYIELEDL